MRQPTNRYEVEYDRGCRMCMQPIEHGQLRIKEPDRQLIHGRKDLVHLACALRTMPFHVEKMLSSLDGEGIDRAGIQRVIELWREVVRDPGDGPRLVLADALHELGDPRAELIALQMLDSDKFERLDRIEALVAQHGNTWLWKLYTLARSAQFERGFVARLELSERELKHDDNDAALGTVVELLPGAAKSDMYKRLVLSPAMTSLRRIEVWDDESLEAFEQATQPLTGVACRIRLDSGWHAGLANLGERFLRAANRCESLREVAVELGSFEKIASSRCFRRLSRIAVAVRDNADVRGARDPLALWYRIPSGIQFAIVPAPTLQPIDEAERRGELSLVRDGARVTARISGQWLGERVFDRLPDGVTRLVVEDAHDELVKKLRALAAAKQIELEAIETPIPTGIWRSAWGG